MDDQPPQKRFTMPRFSIAMVLYVTTCLATCLTIAAEPAADGPELPGLESLGRHIEWQYALMCLASFGVGGALVQHARLISSDPQFRLARWLRLTLAAGIGLSLSVRLLLQQGVLDPPESNLAHVISWSKPFPDAVWFALLIFGVLSLLESSPNSHKVGGWRMPLAVLCSCLLVSLWAAGSLEMHFIFHIATAGIEAQQPLQFQRLGAFPHHALEGYFTYRMAVTAVLGLATTIVAFCVSVRSEKRLVKRLSQCFMAAGIVLLTCFVVWFIAKEYPRISPDFASMDVAGTIQDWIGGGMLLSCAVLWFAMQASRTRDSITAAPTLNRTRLGRLPLVCAALGCFLAGLLNAADVVSNFIEISSLFRPVSFSDILDAQMILILIRPPEVWFAVGLVILGLGLIRKLWLGGELQAAAVDGPSVLVNAIWLTAIAAVAVPTLAIYSFCSWLGPWWMP